MAKYAGDCEHETECECDVTLPTRPAAPKFTPKQYDKLADKFHDAAEKSRKGSPFNGMTFTQEEREMLASVGCV